VVLSRSLPPSISDLLIIANDFDEALRILTEVEPFRHRVETIWNCGGSDVYAMGLDHPWMHKLVLTRIDSDYGCDRFFPTVKWENFERNNDFPEDQWVEEKGVKWSVASYTKKAPIIG